jgi:hypothetical protein
MITEPPTGGYELFHHLQHNAVNYVKGISEEHFDSIFRVEE